MSKPKRKLSAFDVEIAATALSVRHDEFCGNDPNVCTCPMAAAWRNVFDFSRTFEFSKWEAAYKPAKATAWNRTRAKEASR